MPIPMLDLRAQYETIRPEVEAAIRDVMESQQFRGGPVAEAFEREMTAFTGTRHAIGVASGTDALLLALKALSLQPGDEVITTSFSFFATAGAIVNAGGVPVFADIDPVSFNLDPDTIEALITPRTRALLPVHLYGQCADMERMLEIARRHGLAVIEDAAQALGARRNGKAVGAWGHVAALSFYPTKNLGAAGEGGMVLTNDPQLAERVRCLRCHGASALYRHEMVGVNSHLHTLQAAVLRVKLRRLEQWNEARRARADYYRAAMKTLPGMTLPRETTGNYHVYHQFVVRMRARDAVKEHLNACGIATGVFYPIPLHRQTCFAPYVGPGTSCPVAEQAAREVLALPMFPEMTNAQQDQVADALSACAGLKE